MGTNKALLVHDGMPLWEHQRRILERAGAHPVWVSVAQEADWRPAGVAHLVDTIAGVGPVGGIAAVLEQSAATARHAMVLAVDLPRMAAEWFVDLAARCAPGVGGVGRWAEDDAYEPLAAIYPVEALPELKRAIASNDYRLQPVVRALVQRGEMREMIIGAERADWFANWNRPEDVGALRANDPWPPRQNRGG